MGDRVSISFGNGGEESVALFNHWGGMGFVKEAERYARKLVRRNVGKENRTMYPLDRLEPETVIVDFIRHITSEMDSVDSNLYLCKDSMGGDNSDNGHHIIELDNLLAEEQGAYAEYMADMREDR